jgi:hypothetical protein
MIMNKALKRGRLADLTEPVGEVVTWPDGVGVVGPSTSARWAVSGDGQLLLAPTAFVATRVGGGSWGECG